MIERIENQYLPDVVTAPGETLQEILEARGMSQAELADRTGRPKKTINEIIKGKAAITAETAIQLERVLEVPASFWLAREQNYREALARSRELEMLESQISWLDNVPYRAMVKLGWVADHREKSLQLREALRFFGVVSPTTWEGIWATAAFRQSLKLRSEAGAIATWLRRGEIEATQLRCKEFDAQAFRVALASIRTLTQDLPLDFASQLQGLCCECGVAVVFVPEVSGTRVWGATRWLTPTLPLIQLSLRYKTDDHFWFTFYHEAGHILLHGKRDIFVEEQENEGAKEGEADAFARDSLIPPSSYRAFYRKGSFSCAAVSRFAYEIGIAPGIVVGRLQREGYLNRAHCNGLKKKLDWGEN